jgi:hypothetical protein
MTELPFNEEAWSFALQLTGRWDAHKPGGYFF